MRRRAAVSGILAILVAPLAAEAQEAGKVPRIAFILPNTPETEMVGPVPKGRNPRAFLEGLRDLGWIDGQNIKVDRQRHRDREERRERA